jgi:hypothetical protein
MEFLDNFNLKFEDFYNNPLAVALAIGFLVFILVFIGLKKTSIYNKKNKNIIVIISLIIGLFSFYYIPEMLEEIIVFNLLLSITLVVIAIKLLVLPFLRFIKLNF